ncbi:MAG: hypothetical protein ACOC8N_08825 [Spirochaetota bacterium]
MRTRRERVLVFLLLAVLLLVGGCAYHLDYTLSARRGPGTPPAENMTFQIEPDPEREKVKPRTRERMLLTLRESLLEAGWRETAEPAFQFTVDYEKLDDPFGDGLRVGIFFGTGGGGMSALFGLGGRERYERYVITITARLRDPERGDVWSAVMDTGPVSQNPAALARHMIPDAVSRFPEEGYWVVDKRVDLHGR